MIALFKYLKGCSIGQNQDPTAIILDHGSTLIHDMKSWINVARSTVSGNVSVSPCKAVS